jgi:membrane-bound lytic murein transglycosylase D
MRARAYVFAAAVTVCISTGCKSTSTSTSVTRIAQPEPAFATQAPPVEPSPAPAPPSAAAEAPVAAAVPAPQESAPASPRPSAAGTVTSASAGASVPPATPPPSAQATFQERHAPAAIDTFLDANVDTQTPRPETEQAVATELGTLDSDLPIPLNDRVLAYVELFSGRLKGYLEDGLNRGGRYLPMVRDIFEAEGLPLDLSYVPLIESAFKPSALSRAQARGIWQFMRGTALEVGLQSDWYVDERADPEKATRAAARYLKFLYAKFGDWHLALAAYNGGWGRVQRALERSGRSDFWTLSEGQRFLPRETRNYVPLILAAVIVARNPAQYGLALEPLAEEPTEVVALSTPVDLRRLAEYTGTSFDTLQDLNPELRRWTTPARGGSYPLRVPLGIGDMVRERASAPAAELSDPFSTYTVRRGETVLGIAKKLGVRRADLAEANYLSVRAQLQTGQELIIPRPPAMNGSRELTLARNTARDDDFEPAVVRTSARIAPHTADPSRLVHVVKRGETLSSIARLYRTSIGSLQEMNHMRGSVIRPGQRLRVPGRSGVIAD